MVRSYNMKIAKKIGNIIWVGLISLLVWIIVLPNIIMSLYDNIWSVEGFLKLEYYWQDDDKTKKIYFLLLYIGIFFIIVKILESVLRYYIKRKYSKFCIRLQLFNKYQIQVGITETIPKTTFKVVNKLIFLIILLCIGRGHWEYMLDKMDIPYEMRWFEKHTLVAHAFGGIDGIAYTNSQEAFYENYEKGYRVFEVDMCLTSDGYLVAEHDWQCWGGKMGIYDNTYAPSYDEFMSSIFHNKYHPVDLEMIVDLMIRYDDIYIMTDFKVPFNKDKDSTIVAFSQIVDMAKDKGRADILDRFIIQVYSFDFKTWVDEVYCFDNYLYTGYETPEVIFTPDIMVEWCNEQDIPVITMATYLYDEKWYSATSSNNIWVYTHTENDVELANELIQNGCSGIYSDFLSIEEIEQPRNRIKRFD